MRHKEISQQLKDTIEKDGHVWVDQFLKGLDLVAEDKKERNVIALALGSVLAEGYVKYYFPAEPLTLGKALAIVGIFPPGTTYAQAYAILKQAEAAKS